MAFKCSSNIRQMVSSSPHLSTFEGRNNLINGENLADNSESIQQNLPEGFHTKTMSKKINHNASERDRRKKTSNLYSTLKSMLPPEDQSRKLSIPATVSRALKYIPELQKEVARLTEKKARLLSKISKKEEECQCLEFGIKETQPFSLPSISVASVSDEEIMIQISLPRVEKGSFSEALMQLEMEGFLVVNASRFESFGGRVFMNLHLLTQGTEAKYAEMLKEKLWQLLVRKDEE